MASPRTAVRVRAICEFTSSNELRQPVLVGRVFDHAFLETPNISNAEFKASTFVACHESAVKYPQAHYQMVSVPIIALNFQFHNTVAVGLVGTCKLTEAPCACRSPNMSFHNREY